MKEDLNTCVVWMNDYLISGGMWNPECADHDAVSNLIRKSRDIIHKYLESDKNSNKYSCMKILDQNSVKLECKAGSCCPVIKKVEENRFEVTDDYNGKVILTQEQLDMFADAIEHFKSNS